MTTKEIEVLAETRPDVAEAWGRYKAQVMAVKESWCETFFSTTPADGKDPETWQALNEGIEAAMDILDAELKQMGAM